MKRNIYIVLIAGIFSCNNKNDLKGFEVEGTVKNTDARMIYLEENVPNGSPTIMDSATIQKDGSFILKSSPKEEALFQMRLQNMMVPFIKIISDAPKIKLTADLNNLTQPYKIEGSSASQSLLTFDKTTFEKCTALFSLSGSVDSLRKINAPDSVITLQYQKLESGVSSLKTYVQDFLAKSNSPVLTLYSLGSYQKTTNNLGINGFTQTEMTDIINAAAAKFPSHSTFQNIKKNFKAPDFSQPDINGKPVSLSSFKGKYVLLDFWASWCRPCREENPNVVKAYNEFKDKNFTILGVSLDQNQQAWVDAIQQDGLTWTHVNDVNSEASNLYGVNEIPSNFLIDPQGNIIATNLRGNDIIKTLKEVIK